MTTLSTLAADRASVHRQVHLLEQRRVARVAAQLAQEWVHLEKAESAFALRVGALRPLEAAVLLPAPSVDLCDCVGGDVAEPGEQFVERLLRFPRVAQVML